MQQLARERGLYYPVAFASDGSSQIGGNISAEHGIGLLKSPWLDQARSAGEIGMMQGIKRVCDPAGIFNPGKLLPDA